MRKNGMDEEVWDGWERMGWMRKDGKDGWEKDGLDREDWMGYGLDGKKGG